MANKMWALANATSYTVTFSSTEHAQDTKTVQPYTVMHTGGKDGNYSIIADCSGSNFYASHHMTIALPVYNLTFWDNDGQNRLLYFSSNDTYAGGVAWPRSDEYESFALLLYYESGQVHWSVTKWE